MVFKQCFVPSCNITTETHPEKVFLTIPTNPAKRRNWAKALKVPHIPFSSKYRICEDHFNLSEDSTNWLYYSTIGTRKLILKPDVVPHRYLTSRPKDDIGSQLSEAKKRRLAEICEEAVESSKKHKVDKDVSEEENVPIIENNFILYTFATAVEVERKNVSVQVDIRKPCRSKMTNCNL